MCHFCKTTQINCSQLYIRTTHSPLPPQTLQTKAGEITASTEAVKAAAEFEAAGIAAAQKEAAAAIQKIHDDYHVKIVAAKDLLEQTKQEHAAKLAEMEENTQRSLQDAHRRAQNAAERAKAEAERLEAAKIQEIEQIKNLAGSTVTEANKKAEKEKEEIEKRFAEALEAHEEDISAERLRSAQAIAELKDEMETKLTNAQEEAQAKVTQLETKLQTAQEEARTIASKLEANLQKMKDDKAIAKALIAQYEANIEKLEERERSLSSLSRNLQANILKLEEERASTFVNTTNIKREIIAMCNGVASAGYDFVGDLARTCHEWTADLGHTCRELATDLARTCREWMIIQSNRAYSNALNVYFSVLRPAVSETATKGVVGAKMMYASHLQPSMNQFCANIKEKYNEMIRPQVDEYLMPIYEGKVKPAFNQHLLPVYKHVVPAFENHVVPAKDRALDAAVAGWDIAVLGVNNLKQSAWNDIKEALILAEEASVEAYGYVAAFIKSCRLRAFEFSVDGTEHFFDGALGLLQKHDEKGMVPDVAKEKLAAARDNAQAFVEAAAWFMLVGLIVVFLPFLLNIVVFCAKVVSIIAFELASWPFRAAWFLCPLRFFFGPREEGIVPDVMKVSPSASIDEGSQSSSPAVKGTVDMLVRPITPPGQSARGPNTRSRAAKKL
jgi:hypothetical protein